MVFNLGKLVKATYLSENIQPAQSFAAMFENIIK